MPLLFSIGIQGALEEVGRSLKPGQHLSAFLDDIYLLCEPDRVKPLYNIPGEALFRVAGIHLHEGKTRVWNRGGIAPGQVEELGPAARSCDGIKVLGTPLGTAQFVSPLMEERIAEERKLWEAIPNVPDLQCAWQILFQSANPRANHTIRTLPLSVSRLRSSARRGYLGHSAILAQGSSWIRARVSPCAWEGWGCGPRPGVPVPRIGPRGRMPFT